MGGLGLMDPPPRPMARWVLDQPEAEPEIFSRVFGRFSVGGWVGGWFDSLGRGAFVKGFQKK